jgi:pimeloyl-ACP methyl ester carboxylesterase
MIWTQVRRVLTRVVFALVVGAVLFLGGLSWMHAQSLIRPYHSQPNRTPGAFGLPYEDVRLTASDGIELAAWYVPPPSGSDDALIYLHGISSNRGHQLNAADRLYDDGYGGLFLDMRGHGDSESVRRTMGVAEVRDVRAAAEYLLRQPEVGQIGVMGSSYGGSVALLAAGEIPEIEATVAFSPYSSLVGVVGDRAQQMYGLPPRPAADLVVWWTSLYTGENAYQASPRAAMDEIAPRPVLLIHGRQDRVIPYTSAERLEEAGGENVTYWLLENIGHATDVYIIRNRYDDLLVFLNGAF